MELDNILGLIWTSLSIIALLLSGAIWVLVIVSKVSTRVNGSDRDIKELRDSVKDLKNDLEKVKKDVSNHEEKNKHFRHNFESVTKSLEIYISSEITHLKELLSLQFKNMLEKINEKK